MILLAVRHGLPFAELPEPLRGHRGLALIAARAHGAAVALLPQHLRADPDIVAVASQTFHAISFASSTLQSNKAFILHLAETCEAHLVGLLADPFVHDTDFLNDLLMFTIPRRISVFKVSNLAGKTIITSYASNMFITFDNATRECLLGLHSPSLCPHQALLQ